MALPMVNHLEQNIPLSFKCSTFDKIFHYLLSVKFLKIDGGHFVYCNGNKKIQYTFTQQDPLFRLDANYCTGNACKKIPIQV